MTCLYVSVYARMELRRIHVQSDAVSARNGSERVCQHADGDRLWQVHDYRMHRVDSYYVETTTFCNTMSYVDSFVVFVLNESAYIH